MSVKPDVEPDDVVPRSGGTSGEWSRNGRRYQAWSQKGRMERGTVPGRWGRPHACGSPPHTVQVVRRKSDVLDNHRPVRPVAAVLLRHCRHQSLQPQAELSFGSGGGGARSKPGEDVAERGRVPLHEVGRVHVPDARVHAERDPQILLIRPVPARSPASVSISKWNAISSASPPSSASRRNSARQRSLSSAITRLIRPPPASHPGSIAGPPPPPRKRRARSMAPFPLESRHGPLFLASSGHGSAALPPEQVLDLSN